jgi:hypothetical protein
MAFHLVESVDSFEYRDLPSVIVCTRMVSKKLLSNLAMESTAEKLIGLAVVLLVRQIEWE